MINFIPIFPLDIIVYPGESLNLHIFEPRYKELIKECIAEKKQFGIPFVLEGRIQELGTLMEVTELVKEYEDGQMDIRTQAIKIFRTLEIVKSIPDKLYSGAIVNYPDNLTTQGDSDLARLIVAEVHRLYVLLSAEDKWKDSRSPILSYEIAHFIGLSKEQEYELLNIFTEIQRLEYIRRHLNAMLPIIKELEEMKARIRRNGHFRDLSLDDFNL